MGEVWGRKGGVGARPMAPGGVNRLRRRAGLDETAFRWRRRSVTRTKPIEACNSVAATQIPYADALSSAEEILEHCFRTGVGSLRFVAVVRNGEGADESSQTKRTLFVPLLCRGVGRGEGAKTISSSQSESSRSGGAVSSPTLKQPSAPPSDSS